jgi:hypothetical protein
MPPAVAVHNISVGLCRGETCGEKLEAMAHISPSQPNEAMARIAPRSPMVQMVKLHSTQARYVGLDSKLFSKVQVDSKRGMG